MRRYTAFAWLIGGICQFIHDVYMFFRHEADPIKVITMLAVFAMMIVWGRWLVLFAPGYAVDFYNYVVAWYNHVPPGLQGMMLPN